MKKRVAYDFPEPCHCCGAMPTNQETGLCRHCDDGGDVLDDNDDDPDACVHGVSFTEVCEQCECEETPL